MTHRLAWGTWRGRVGACAALAALVGCNGNNAINGTGGSSGGSRATGGAGATGGTHATGGSGGMGGQAGGSSGSGGMTVGPFGNKVDILMMIDNSSSMTSMQQKLYAQLPSFVSALQSLPTPPSLHLAVVSSDMGAPGDSTSEIQCSTFGDDGELQSAPRSNSMLNPPVACTDSTIAVPVSSTDNDHTFISDDNGTENFTAPLATVLQCIALLGDKGCGFEHQLASIDHALGADNLEPDANGVLQPNPPATNANFLRPDAYLVILILTNEDDCSATPPTDLYSLNAGGSNQQNIMNALGPISNYRCNAFGHLCQDPASAAASALIEPPLNAPADHQGPATAPTLDLADCESNDTNGLLTPVSKFVNDIKALKPNPDTEILVAAIAAPATPYTVAWFPEQNGQNTQPGELWPQLEHSCGPSDGTLGIVNPKATQLTTDESFGDPGVRIAQFTGAFANNVSGSICDPSYATTLNAVAGKIGQMIGQP